MAYDKSFTKNDWCGGPFPDNAVTKGNTKRPQSYIGKYTFDGKPNMGPQAVRKELPKAGTNSSLLDGAYDGGAPDTDTIFKKHR